MKDQNRGATADSVRTEAAEPTPEQAPESTGGAEAPAGEAPEPVTADTAPAGEAVASVSEPAAASEPASVSEPVAPAGETAQATAGGEQARTDKGEEVAASGLGAELEALRAEVEERTKDLQRVSAEYANYRRRVERDRARAAEQTTAAVLVELLGVLDDVDRAREHGDLVGPFGAVADQLTSVLTKLGLTPFGVGGDTFDPTRHEAVAHSVSSEVTEPTCVQVFRRGYTLGERLLRPALVAVADPSGEPVAEESAVAAGNPTERDPVVDASVPAASEEAPSAEPSGEPSDEAQRAVEEPGEAAAPVDGAEERSSAEAGSAAADGDTTEATDGQGTDSDLEATDSDDAEARPNATGVKDGDAAD